KKQKVGIVVKGCDSRAVIELLQEKLINKDNLVVFGLHCDGVVSLEKIRKRIGELGLVSSAQVNGDTLTVTRSDDTHSLPISEIRMNKCEICQYPNALISDHFIGSPVDRDDSVAPVHESVEEFDTWSLEERFAFWKREMSRCIRCYACRNTCPMCVCKNHCVAVTREPHWLSQENTAAENWMFQMIHVMHLTGRCVVCGECERACPMGIQSVMSLITIPDLIHRAHRPC
ncbi:MAG: 4Fe-4S dicluster domain-containing protein, partial [Deltaproteobacteria bacterium]|nr:4Fe-4S dicluster domain-containing protein [Deltaproteobacteria bacterium]